MSAQQPTREETHKSKLLLINVAEKERRDLRASPHEAHLANAIGVVLAALALAERDARRYHCHQVDAFRICSDCNKEFQLSGGRTNHAWTTNNQACPHCGVINQTWIELRDATQAAQRKDGAA